MNKFLNYYKEQNILPIKQNISNMENHLRKRENLYRQLGIPAIAFKDKNILEVGAGSGYNTLAFFHFECKKITIVEPNKNGIKEMKQLFENTKLFKMPEIDIQNKTIEEFNDNNKYDFIIAEGFLHSIDNAKDIILNLLDKLDNGGILVVTCMDYCSMFIEQMKRLVSSIIISNISDYNEKVKKCTEIFEGTMKNLKNMSRSIEDWVKDDILNPAFNNDIIFTIKDVIELINNDYYILGTSQNIFTDFSWYKDIDNFKELSNNYLKQYLMKRHNFIMYGQEETIINLNKSNKIYNILTNIRNFSKQYEENNENEILENILKFLEDLLIEFKDINNNIYEFIERIINCLKEFLETGKISNYKNIFKSGDIGRTQQYISIQKKYRF